MKDDKRISSVRAFDGCCGFYRSYDCGKTDAAVSGGNVIGRIPRLTDLWVNDQISSFRCDETCLGEWFLSRCMMWGGGLTHAGVGKNYYKVVWKLDACSYSRMRVLYTKFFYLNILQNCEPEK